MPMKRLALLAVLSAAVVSTVAQEKLPREECLKYAFITCVNLKEMLNTPIPTDPDVKRPVALHDGDYGGLVFPESKLKADTFAKADKEPVAVGQLWMVKLAPVKDGQVVPASKLRMVHLRSGDNEADAVCCALGVRKNGEALELLIYGKGKEPVVQVPLKSTSGTQDDPIDMSAERTDEGGDITLRFLGKYEARLKVTDPDR